MYFARYQRSHYVVMRLNPKSVGWGQASWGYQYLGSTFPKNRLCCACTHWAYPVLSEILLPSVLQWLHLLIDENIEIRKTWLLSTLFLISIKVSIRISSTNNFINKSTLMYNKNENFSGKAERKKKRILLKIYVRREP